MKDIKNISSVRSKMDFYILNQLNHNENNNIKSYQKDNNSSINVKLEAEKYQKLFSKPFENQDVNLNVYKYINLRMSQTKLFFGICDVVNIICNSYCKRKISKRISESFKFYEKARTSVSHYFEIIFIFKKF